MKKADLYTTLNNQHRLILGITPNGDIAFATRGGNTSHDYNYCQIQSRDKFASEGVFAQTVSDTEICRVEYCSATTLRLTI